MKRSESNPKPRLSGLYITLETRKSILRNAGKTHFQLTDSEVDFSTTNKQAYKKQALGSVSPKPAIDRNSHWTLGDTSFSAETESLWRFRQIYGPETSAKSLQKGEVNQPNKQRRFALGRGDVIDIQSTMKDSYLKHDLEEKCDSQAKRLKGKMEMHNFALGGDKSEFLTVSRSQYTPKESLSVGLGKVREQFRVRNNNKSGNYSKFDSLLQSTASAAFPRYNYSIPKQSLPHPQETHIKFGDQLPTYTSSAQSSYQNLVGDKAEFHTDGLKDLRMSHFTLGFYSEERKPKLEETAVIKTGPAHVQAQKTNIKLGNVKEKWISSYEANHRILKSDQPQLQSTGESTTLSHFTLGQQPFRLQSTSQDHYKPRDHPVQVTSLPPDREKDLRTQHFSIGENMNRDWKRVSEKYGQEVDSVKTVPNLVQNKDIWTHHFRYGSYESDYKRSSKLQAPETWEGAALDEETRKKLTGTSTQLGSNETYMTDSTYQDSFLWIQPAADTKYKMSIQEHDIRR